MQSFILTCSMIGRDSLWYTALESQQRRTLIWAPAVLQGGVSQRDYTRWVGGQNERNIRQKKCMHTHTNTHTHTHTEARTHPDTHTHTHTSRRKHKMEWWSKRTKDWRKINLKNAATKNTNQPVFF